MKKRRGSRIAFAGIFSSIALFADARAEEFAPCTRHECSNDVAVGQQTETIAGDEAMRWDPVPGWEVPTCPSGSDDSCTPRPELRCYEIAAHPGVKIVHRACERNVYSSDIGWRHTPPSNYFYPYRVPPEDFPRIGSAYGYKVRACLGGECGEWSPQFSSGTQDFVGFVGTQYACLESDAHGGCEAECYPGAPKMLFAFPDCP